MVWGFSFGLVNIMQPQNCTTRLRRLVWTSFFLCVVFLFRSFLCDFVYHSGYWLREECIFFFQLHLNTTNFVCQVHFLDNDFERFHFEICADLPPGRHTMMLYLNTNQRRKWVQSFGEILGHVLETNIWHNIIEPRLRRLLRTEARLQVRLFFNAHNVA